MKSGIWSDAQADEELELGEPRGELHGVGIESSEVLDIWHVGSAGCLLGTKGS